jgi:hypothetical protein
MITTNQTQALGEGIVSEKRIWHVLSCFFGGHTYERLGQREGHNEYTCLDCGHPLLFSVDKDPYIGKGRFLKKVRYLCNLFGHKVHEVCQRHGYTEYACDCGHSFLKEESGLPTVTHPLICTFLGHYIHEIDRRDGVSETLCRNCGHTFCLPLDKELL